MDDGGIVQFLLLGGLEIRAECGSRATFRSELQRTLMHVLLVSEGKTVSVDALIDELWGELPPSGVVNALQALVSRLRKKLASLERGREASRLIGHPYGYQLVVDEDELDASSFVAAVTRAQAADGRPCEVVDMLRAALARWRGPVFGGEASGPICRAAAARYEEYRIRALELLFENELARGNHAGILGELREKHAENPLQERFCAQLMIALYRCGRQAEALSSYREMWSRLSEELGIEPSIELRRTEQAILTQELRMSA
ncbi:AfsR/SARP family transcriptional regulator [Streptomyces sp. NRRL B-24085]|uniref:AfsR/SARP family transcriptional regulator n=1 Tax=Streptomyces sp. NRRL B-24085 TaxID=1709476 RepID=UPI0007C6E294|nr:AfsR/SARP family transcriptional regulator [Streptomyces sp. NRRL B-24085]